MLAGLPYLRFREEVFPGKDAMIANAGLWTVKELDSIPNNGGWTRYEIVSGELLVTRAPHAFHQSAASKLHIYLGIWSERTKLGRVLQTPGLIFTPFDAVIPDLIWVSNDRFANALDDAGHFTVAPELVVEVLSPGKENEKRDRETKLELYSRYGVEEYWIASWQRQTIEVYRREAEGLAFARTLGVEDTLSSPLLPGLNAPIAPVFG